MSIMYMSNIVVISYKTIHHHHQIQDSYVKIW